MRRSFLYLLGFLIPALAFIAAVNSMTDKSLRTRGTQHTYEWNSIYNGELNADIYMLGSSRAWVHLNPDIFDSVTGLNSYNLGMDAYAIDIQLDRFWAAIHHNKKPKYIIQNMDALTLRRSGYVDYDKIQFLPYLNEPELRDDLIENGLRWEERFFPVFKYRGMATTVYEALKKRYKNEYGHSWKTKGYAGQNQPWSKEFAEFKKMYTTYDIAFEPDMIARLKAMIAYCDSSEIKVIITHLPLYDEATAMMTDKYRIDSLMNSFQHEFEGSCYYWDYSKTSFSNDTNFFYNATHMNYKGADSISLMLARRLRELDQGR